MRLLVNCWKEVIHFLLSHLQNRQNLPNIIFGFLSSTEYRKRHCSRPNSRVFRIRFPGLHHTHVPDSPDSTNHRACSQLMVNNFFSAQKYIKSCDPESNPLVKDENCCGNGIVPGYGYIGRKHIDSGKVLWYKLTTLFTYDKCFMECAVSAF